MKIVILSLVFMLSNPLAKYKWENRIILIFTNDRELLAEQYSKFEDSEAGFQDRDLLVFEISDNSSNPLSAKEISWLKENYNKQGDNFKVLLIGKDGTKKLQTDRPVTAEVLFSTIDKMPMRKAEMKNDIRR